MSPAHCSPVVAKVQNNFTCIKVQNHIAKRSNCSNCILELCDCVEERESCKVELYKHALHISSPSSLTIYQFSIRGRFSLFYCF